MIPKLMHFIEKKLFGPIGPNDVIRWSKFLAPLLILIYTCQRRSVQKFTLSSQNEQFCLFNNSTIIKSQHLRLRNILKFFRFWMITLSLLFLFEFLAILIHLHLFFIEINWFKFADIIKIVILTKLRHFDTVTSLLWRHDVKMSLITIKMMLTSNLIKISTNFVILKKNNVI